MTCKHGYIKGGGVICRKGYHPKIMQCLGKGVLPECYEEREKLESKNEDLPKWHRDYSKRKSTR